MAGKKETTKNLKNPESEVVSDSETNDIVASDSEESESFEVSLKSELQKKIEKSRKIEANQLISESESEGEEDEEVEETEGEEEVEESEGEKVENVKKMRNIEGNQTSIPSKKGVGFEKPSTKSENHKREIISESESEGEEDEETEGEEEVEESGGEDVEESEGEKEENVKKMKKIERNNGCEKSKGKGNWKMSDKKGKGKGKEIDENVSESGMYKLPMRRISRIIKDDNPDMRITHEATFLINKATEKFLELFAREAYVCAFVDRKNLVAYNHLSSVVAKRSRLDFLSDFVPEKIKAEVALAKFSMKEK
ncbi:DNA-binding transcription factor [Lithospermum erythrorhizon]|uniref:DNA-binding transcription factor n=1 Tax=Lithospermum erythrorhizon TaxID=34254 RepID=A0AAV3R8I1_LITER